MNLLQYMMVNLRRLWPGHDRAMDSIRWRTIDIQDEQHYLAQEVNKLAQMADKVSESVDQLLKAME